jgi:hypothetical protein
MNHMCALLRAARNDDLRHRLKISPPKCKGCRIFFTDYPSLWSDRQLYKEERLTGRYYLSSESALSEDQHKYYLTLQTQDWCTFPCVLQRSRGIEVVYKSLLFFITESQKSQSQFKTIENNEVQPPHPIPHLEPLCISRLLLPPPSWQPPLSLSPILFHPMWKIPIKA